MFFVRVSDGTRLAVYDPNPCGCPAAVLIHGWPLSEKIFEYQVNFLLERNYRVITMDLRGFGNSDMPAAGYCYDRMAGDIYEVIKQMGLCGFILCGFSMGGAVVLRYMRLFCGYGVRKLALFAAAAPKWVKSEDFPFGQDADTVDELIRLAETDRPRLAANFAQNQLFASPHSEAVKKWFRDIALTAGGYSTIRTAIALKEEDGREDLPAVHVPTAIFQGDRDEVVPTDLTMYQYRNIPGAVLYRFAGSGHGVMYDELERFNACLLEFMEDEGCRGGAGAK